MKIKRRDFLKLSVAAGAAASMGRPVMNAFAESHGNKQIGEAPGEWKASTCQGCTTWCPVEIFVQDGRAVKVRGNPLSKQNDGSVCPRGHLSLQQVYDPDRVKVPMKRTNPKKGRGIDPKFVPISWDEAFNTIADKMMELRNNGEPEKYLLMRGRYTYMRDIIYDGVTKIFGSPNNLSHSSICAEAENFGAYYTEGMWGYRDYDISNSKYVLVWGCDPVSSNRLVPATIKRLGDVLDQATVAVVDPKLNNTAAKAQEWLPLLPGTDGALALAIAHVLLSEGLWFKEFVGDFTDGKNRFKAGMEVDEATFAEKESHGVVKWWNIAVKDMTPKKAAEITQVPEEQIVRVARGMAKAAPNVAVWMGPGAAMHVRGAYSAMAVNALNGLVGGIDNVGGTLPSNKVPVKHMPKLDAYQDEIAKKGTKNKKIDQRGTKSHPALKEGKPGGGVITNNAATGILASDPYEIKVAVGYMNNFVFSCTGAERWEKAMEKIPFFAHITTHASEMTQYADIVLPGASSMYEKLCWVKQKQNRYAQCTLLQQVVKPMWEVINDETEFPWMLGEKFAERGFPNLIDFLKKEFKDPETGKEATNSKEFTEYAVKYYTQDLWNGKDVGGDKINGWAEMQKRGMWNSDAQPYKKRWGGKFGKDEEKDGKKTTKGTVTHKFEFYSETLKHALEKHAEKHKTTVDDILAACNYTAAGELAFVPHYEPPFRYGSMAEYPFTFIDYKSRLNREGRSANSPWYNEFKHVDPGDVGHQDVLKINPADAKKLGIKDGDALRVTSVAATIDCTARLWEGIRPGTVAKAFGQGHWAYGKVAAKDYTKAEPRGGNNNTLMPFDTERLSGGNVRNGGFTGVKIERV
ncbi:MAG: molybdopterin-dependent oxidoreductase [Proteobacteria bacterium]|nr:molybdopterin-dependent oxidoreductase [Pseudomonadota bacterium]MBU1739783.1 molybdopterin-dependent oxidoreductase [Pseudomonadota bacterium]